MSNSFIDDLQDLTSINNLDKPSANPHKALAREKEVPTFPCDSCGGTGVYRGIRVHQPKTQCFACKGKGFFKKSKKDRMASKERRLARKANLVSAAQAAIHEQYPGLIEASRKLTWNDFVRDILQRFDERGSLTDRQAQALQNQIDKAKVRDEQRAIERANRDARSTVDTSAIRSLFDVAKSNGIKKPGLWFGNVKISEAPSTGVNAGALYVKINKEYAGKIVGSTFKGAWGIDHDAVLSELLSIASNPAETLRVKGKETGVCCCCGRTLTDPVSVAAGIGPTCAENWGL